MIDVEFASWIDAKSAFYEMEQSVIIDRENFDRILILNQDESETDLAILNILDIVIGGDWVDLKPDNRVVKNKLIDLVKEYYLNKGKT